MSREADLEFAREVPGSEGMLWAIDLRDYGWNNAAWRAVAQREPYFREAKGGISHDAAETLRQLIHATRNETTLHVEGVVRADWFFRETIETDRSGAYYDLLYARERFGDREYHQGKQYADGWYFKGENQGGFIDANFPRDEKDLEKALGVDVVVDLLRKQRLRVEHGAVVEEGASIVARQNRLLWRIPIASGSYYKTFDTLKTADKKDFAEKYPEVTVSEVEFDAGEIIFTLPNGGQGYMLIDGKRKRIESADGKAAIDSSDSHDRRVRTPGSCTVCHGIGINRPDNLVENLLREGFDVKFRDAKRAREVRAFFLNWDRKLKSDQDGYTEFVKRTSGLKGEENATAFKSFRDSYDAPVDFRQACAETGLTEQQMRFLGQKTPNVRLLMLIRGRSIPRAVWEANTYSEVSLLSVARKEGVLIHADN